MGTITILEETTKNPITLMGKRAGVCWGGGISNDELNYKRGMGCITSNHGRVMEFVNVEMVLDGYSARVIREWYTHIGGAPTRLQASTRYIDYVDFDYIEPPVAKDDPIVSDRYNRIISQLKDGIQELHDVYDVPNEDLALLLPLGMTTTVVDKRNLRNLVDMSKQRMCNRAYWEYRQLFKDVSDALREISEEWSWIVDNLFHPKCVDLGRCPEKNSCKIRLPRPWSSEEDAIIKKYYPAQGTECVRRPGLSHRTAQAVRTRASQLGVRIQKRRGGSGKPWTDEELNILRDHWENSPTLCHKLLKNRTTDAVRKKATELGLHNRDIRNKQ